MNEIVYDFSKEKATNGQHVQYAQDSLAEVPEEMATKYGFSLQYNTMRSGWLRITKWRDINPIWDS